MFAQRLDVDLAASPPSVVGRVLELLDQAVAAPDALLMPPSMLAAAVLCVARKDAGCVPPWPSLLASLTGHSLTSTLGAGGHDLGRCVSLVEQWTGVGGVGP